MNQNSNEKSDSLEALTAKATKKEKEELIIYLMINEEELLREVEERHADRLELLRANKEIESLKKELKTERTARTRERKKFEKEKEETLKVKEETLKVVDEIREVTNIPETPPPVEIESNDDTVPGEDFQPKPKEKKKKVDKIPSKKKDLRQYDEVPLGEREPLEKHTKKMTTTRLKEALHQKDPMPPWQEAIARTALADKEKAIKKAESSGTTNAELIRDLMVKDNEYNFDKLTADAVENFGITEDEAYLAIDHLEREGEISFPSKGVIIYGGPT